MLRLYLLPQLEDRQPDMVFQQHGAPPHWSCIARELLVMHFPGPGLSVMDQFRGLRAHPILRRLISSCAVTLRTLFRRPLLSSLDELKLRIAVAFKTVPLQTLENPWRKIEYRLDILRAKNGAHVAVI
jgi:hypothetical protein